MFVRQNSCVLLEDGAEDSTPPQEFHALVTPSTPVPAAATPTVSDDKLKLKSR